jgi:KinB signaling pathway activation protein
MTLKRYGLLLLSTVAVGISIGILNAITGIFGNIRLFFGVEVGGFVAATSLMGFWAYLMLNFTVRNFLPWRYWIWVQILLVGLVFYDMVYFRYLQFSGGRGSLLPYVVFATIPLLWAILVAFMKTRVSGTRSFVPTVFFMYCFTILEWFVALKSGIPSVTHIIGTILMGCNAYVILLLGKMVKPQSQ